MPLYYNISGIFPNSNGQNPEKGRQLPQVLQAHPDIPPCLTPKAWLTKPVHADYGCSHLNLLCLESFSILLFPTHLAHFYSKNTSLSLCPISDC